MYIVQSPVDGADPDPYVKTYLRPDPYHSTKRKTKVARKTLHPTYNEMVRFLVVALVVTGYDFGPIFYRKSWCSIMKFDYSLECFGV